MTNESNARQFALDLTNLLRDATEDAVVKATRKMAADAFEGVIKKSPVGNDQNWKRPAPKGYVGGQFRGAWQLSVGAPGIGITGKSRPGKTGSDSAARAAVAEARGELAKLQPYQSVYIVNGLPYAERLENGWSKQAPLGIVALTVQELQNVILSYENGEVK